MEFCDKVKYVRKKLNLSQEELAEALHVSFATVNRWENTRHKPFKMAQKVFNDFCKEKSISFEESETDIKNIEPK